MKKILFVLPYYKIGGTLTSFINLIPSILRSDYEIDVYALTNVTDDINLLPKGVNYIGLNVDNKILSASNNKKIKNKIISVLKYIKRKIVKIGYDPSDLVFKKMANSLSGKYDVVIAYQEGQSTRMAQYITAPLKIAWVHCIYSRFKNNGYMHAIAAYNHYDKIVCVSHTAAEDMIICEPQWKDKVNVVYNAVDYNLINNKAGVGVSFRKSVNLISIGRIDTVKRFSYIPHIASKLRDLGIDFDWWIIGNVAIQEEYERLISNIINFKVDDCVHPIGSLSNPYPYIKSSDLLVCLSSSETFNYTIAEAKAIGIPVITTDFSSAYEFVKNEETGIIMPIEYIADGILRLLTDKNLYLKIQNNLIKNKNQSFITKEQFESLLKNE